MKKLSFSCCMLILLSLSAAPGAQTPAGNAPRPTGTVGAPLAPVDPLTTPTPAPAPSASAAGADYRLVNGDKLRIEVYREPQLSHSLQIRPDGKISLPLAGDLAAAGQTPAALRDAIATALKEYVTNPVVTVIVVETQ